MAREELQVWLLAESPDGRWSDAVYVESEELGVRSEELGDEPEIYSSATATRRSPSPKLGEESGMRDAPPE
jgi:hypothetical protein